MGGKGGEAIFGDCIFKGVDKRVAIRKLVETLHIDKINIYAFGDANVDIPMFAFAVASVYLVGGGDEK